MHNVSNKPKLAKPVLTGALTDTVFKLVQIVNKVDNEKTLKCKEHIQLYAYMSRDAGIRNSVYLPKIDKKQNFIF